MASIETYFPTGIVTGDAFCNREHEREYLAKRFQQNAHVVLMSPRRYGKSSLIAQFTVEQNVPFSAIDLLPATSGKYIKNAIINGVTQLLDAIMPRMKKSKQRLLAHFAKMNPVIELSAFGQRIKLNPDDKTDEETVMKLLMSLGEAAQEMNKKIIFVMDEFQQIALVENSHSLEASIRHAVERSKNVFYVFSGSNRTLLEDMFNNMNRPLYHLCDEIKLNRISEDYYIPFINNAAKATWRSTLADDCLAKIMALTECHPYYVNRLCRSLWDSSSLPDVEFVERTWQTYIEAQKIDWVADMISQLSINQKKILVHLAKNPNIQIQSKRVANKVGMVGSSIQRTVEILLRGDLIYKDNNGNYRVLNPVIKAILANDKYS